MRVTPAIGGMAIPLPCTQDRCWTSRHMQSAASLEMRTFMRALRCMLRCSASDVRLPAALLEVGLSGERPRPPSALSIDADRPLL